MYKLLPLFEISGQLDFGVTAVIGADVSTMLAALLFHTPQSEDSPPRSPPYPRADLSRASKKGLGRRVREPLPTIELSLYRTNQGCAVQMEAQTKPGSEGPARVEARAPLPSRQSVATAKSADFRQASIERTETPSLSGWPDKGLMGDKGIAGLRTRARKVRQDGDPPLGSCGNPPCVAPPGNENGAARAAMPER